eukprot:1184191-Prorocentrum_minimum.AAC.1
MVCPTLGSPGNGDPAAISPTVQATCYVQAFNISLADASPHHISSAPLLPAKLREPAPDGHQHHEPVAAATEPTAAFLRVTLALATLVLLLLIPLFLHICPRYFKKRSTQATLDDATCDAGGTTTTTNTQHAPTRSASAGARAQPPASTNEIPPASPTQDDGAPSQVASPTASEKSAVSSRYVTNQGTVAAYPREFLSNPSQSGYFYDIRYE